MCLNLIFTESKFENTEWVTARSDKSVRLKHFLHSCWNVSSEIIISDRKSSVIYLNKKVCIQFKFNWKMLVWIRKLSFSEWHRWTTSTFEVLKCTCVSHKHTNTKNVPDYIMKKMTLFQPVNQNAVGMLWNFRFSVRKGRKPTTDYMLCKRA